MTCKDPTWDPDTASQSQWAMYKQLLRNITNANSDALIAGNTLAYSDIDQLVQGSALLSAITENSESGGDTTIDMNGREYAVKLIDVSSKGR